ncbi:MAG: magnesium/cobalt transporter CorA [Bacteroidales bacterium]|nr:magnesium/cobalt transporter CorA [Bacteroidales bacterium]
MARFFKDRSKAKDQAPGSLIFIGNIKEETPRITYMSYNKDKLNEIHDFKLDDLSRLRSDSEVHWLNVYGLHDSEIINKIGSEFNISNILLEDILNTDNRPKFEEGDENLDFLVKILNFDNSTGKVNTEQISIILGRNYVITFQEAVAKHFEGIRERIRKSKGKVRTSGPDYLAYIILDSIIDNYLITIGTLGEKIEDMGERVLSEIKESLVNEIYNLKVELNLLRKNILPVKEMLLLWHKSDTIFVDKQTKLYLRDILDLTTQAVESVEIYSTLLADSLAIYNTTISNRGNEIMKVFTIFAAIFIPLTFIAGIYGMNFEYMPELKFKYSYPILWLILLSLGFGLLFIFKRKKWL